MLLGRADDHSVFPAADDRLLDVGEERAQGIKVPGRERVELVVVALRAAGRLAEPRGTDRANTVGKHPRLVVLGLRASLLGREQEPVERRPDAGLLAGVRHKVAGHLMDRELVEGLVVVETPDHPVAIGPDIPRGVAVVADRVGKANDIEPADRHLLAVVRAGEQAVYKQHVCIRTCVRDECRDLVRSGRQAEQVEGKPANERPSIGLGRRREADLGQPLPHEMIHPVGIGRHLGLHRFLIGPVQLVFRPFLDPSRQELLLLRVELLVRLRRRHQFVRVGRVDPRHERAFRWLAGHDRTGRYGIITVVQPQIGLPMAGIRPVAIKAVVGKNRPDVAVERNLIRQYGRRRKNTRRECTRNRTATACKAVHHRIAPLENTRFAARSAHAPA